MEISTNALYKYIETLLTSGTLDVIVGIAIILSLIVFVGGVILTWWRFVTRQGKAGGVFLVCVLYPMLALLGTIAIGSIIFGLIWAGVNAAGLIYGPLAIVAVTWLTRYGLDVAKATKALPRGRGDKGDM